MVTVVIVTIVMMIMRVTIVTIVMVVMMIMAVMMKLTMMTYSTELLIALMLIQMHYEEIQCTSPIGKKCLIIHAVLLYTGHCHCVIPSAGSFPSLCTKYHSILNYGMHNSHTHAIPYIYRVFYAIHLIVQDV